MVRYNRNVRYNVRLLEQVYRFRSECTVPPQVATGSTFFSFLWRISKQTKNNILLFYWVFRHLPPKATQQSQQLYPGTTHAMHHQGPRMSSRCFFLSWRSTRIPCCVQGRSCRKSLTMMRPRGVGKIIWYNRDYVQPTSWGRMDCRFPLIVFFKPPNHHYLFESTSSYLMTGQWDEGSRWWRKAWSSDLFRQPVIFQCRLEPWSHGHHRMADQVLCASGISILLTRILWSCSCRNCRELVPSFWSKFLKRCGWL